MSEKDETETTDSVESTTKQKGSKETSFTPPASQADLDRIIADRVSRERAKYADYDELKTQAEKYAEFEESQKSELEKALEAREAAETALKAKEAEALRLQIAAKHGITGEHLDFLSGADETELEAKAVKLKALIEPIGKKGSVGPYVPPEGTGLSGSVGSTTADAFASAVENLLN